MGARYDDEVRQMIARKRRGGYFIQCSYCGREYEVERWEYELAQLVELLLSELGPDDRFRWRYLPATGLGRDGKTAMHGYTVGFRWHRPDRGLDVMLVAKRSARYGKWFPVGRVLFWIRGDQAGEKE